MSEVSLSLCVDCNKFAGHTDNKCSVCSGTNPNYTPDGKHFFQNLADEKLDEWIQTGIHTRNVVECECAICLENKHPGYLVSNFACECHPNVCETCCVKIDKCPFCKKGKYLKIEKEHIRSLLVNNFNVRSRSSIVILAYEKNYTFPFSFNQVVCFAKDIDEVILEINEQDCSKINSIYCLAPDFFRLQLENLTYVICYKGFDEMNLHSKSYKNLIKSRLMMDKIGLMRTFIRDSET